MGMQSLRLKLRKRKYKLSLRGGGGDAAPWSRSTNEGPTAFSNAGSEWEFENFSPWIFSASAKKPSNDATKEEEEEELEEEAKEARVQDDEDVKYWGPRPRVQGLVHPLPARQPTPTPPPPPPPSHPPPTPPRYGILSYFPRRPSSWSPTSTASAVPPPVPPHAWQVRRRATARAGQTNSRASSPPAFPPPPPKNRPTSASHTDLKRSASCYQEPRDAAVAAAATTSRVSVSDSLSDLRSPSVNGSSSWGARAASRLKRVQSELGSDQQLLCPRQSPSNKVEPAYIAPYRCRSTNEVRPLRPLRKHSAAASLRHLHNGLKSTLASSESHLSGSYTLLSDDIDRTEPLAVPCRPPLPSSPSPPPPPPHRSPAVQRASPPPPPVPPHGPGVLCTRITSNVPVYAVVLRGRPPTQDSTGAGDKQSGLGSNGRSFNDGSRDGARDRRSGTGSGSDSFGEADRRAGYTPPYEEELDSSGASIVSKKKVSRSESLRERAQRKHREKRKHSDPNLPPSHSSDMDREDRSLSNNNSGSSSNSSLSTSLESPSPSDIRVSGSALSDGSSGVSAALSVASAGGVLTPWDSDLEADPDPPDWTRNLDPDVVDKMTPKEKQRQEVINELFHTERSHVRNLKVLDRVFYRPLLDNGFSDLVNLLFPNLPDMLEIHGRFNALMKARKRDQPAVETVGDILVAMFDGPNGEAFQQAAATFCKYQSVALESLRDRRKKDSKLQAFLAEAEGNPVCRRLQLKDIIPTAMQRLTKYPLLLESLAKYTQPRSEEMTLVRRCLERSREILNKVNQAIKEAENYNRLVDIQRRLDKSAFEKSDHAIANELKNFELTKHRLIYEGALTWRTKGQKNVDLHVVLLEEYILLLQKQDDKYVLKFHSINYLNSKEESKCTHSPIIKIATVLVRPVATDKLALYLVNTSPTGAQIYDLVAVSIAERKAWFRHITDATEAYKAREGRNRRPDGSGSGSSPMGSATPSLSSSSSSAQLLPPPQAADPSDKTKDDEPIEDNVSADSGVSLTPSSNETPPQSEPTSEQQSQQQQQSQPTNLEATQAEASKKAGESSSSAASASGSTSPASGSTAASPAPQRRLQRVEILKIAEGTPLIDPTEVVVSQGAVLTAEPVLTPLEKLRRKDQMIRAALADKQRLVADILHVPHSELDPASELLSESEGEKEARLLVMTAIAQATQLTAVLNDSLRITEEEAIAAVSADPTPVTSPSSPRTTRRINRMPGAPTTKLLAITSALNKDLTQLLGIVTSRDEERDQLRRELQKTRDQLAEQLVLQAASHPPTFTSRPVSHVSLSDCEATIESEQSEGAPASPETDIQAPSGDGESNDGNELLVDNSIAPVEADSALPILSPCDEVGSAINSNLTLSEDVVDTVDIGEKTELEVSQSSEA